MSGTGKTPGQRAYEGSLTVGHVVTFEGPPWTWEQLPPHLRESWEAAAATAAQRVPELGAVACEAAETGALRERLDEIQAERDGLTGRIEALAGELKAVRGERDRLYRLLAEAVDPAAQDYDNAAEILDLRESLAAANGHNERIGAQNAQLREQLAIARGRLTGIALGNVGDPSVAADRALTAIRELAPAITGAGTEHAVRQLLDHRDPDGPGGQRVAGMPEREG